MGLRAWQRPELQSFVPTAQPFLSLGEKATDGLAEHTTGAVNQKKVTAAMEEITAASAVTAVTAAIQGPAGTRVLGAIRVLWVMVMVAMEEATANALGPTTVMAMEVSVTNSKLWLDQKNVSDIPNAFQYRALMRSKCLITSCPILHLNLIAWKNEALSCDRY